MMMDGLFVRVKNTSLHRLRRLALIVFGIMLAMFQLCGYLGIRLNASPSLPIGLYVTSNDARANLVEFCPAEPFATLATARGYRDQGICPDGSAPLMKPVAATAGDVVELSEKGIAVNSVLLPHTQPLKVDTKGRPLTPWPFGRYIVTANTIWVASSYDHRSFDSRYFGPVQMSAVRDRVRPLLTAS